MECDNILKIAFVQLTMIFRTLDLGRYQGSGRLRKMSRREPAPCFSEDMEHQKPHLLRDQ